ncbi:MAG: hypothetical protein JRI25_22880, partial [Deltaproteobacteria bacterium]|nr:hypothetical protein [Deltaproteobacteria bacterium]
MSAETRARALEEASRYQSNAGVRRDRAPAKRSAPAPKPAQSTVSNSVAAAAVQGTGSDDGGAAAAPVTRTYTCTLGDNTFSVTCGEETQTIGLSGFGGSYGHLQIESLSAAVKIGGSGPQGAVRGTATVAGCVACKVRGHFEGTALRLRVKATGAHPVWEGLELSDLNLAVGEGGVQGGGHAGYTLAGVEGTV